ncbi:IS5 family transposase [Escherichia coli]|uniref:IS5 family transposase n=1 Tax=Escherichia coli TaxID=562 RepID=UPI001F480A24|nr:IS5 family transposase [Escherichia coli]EKC3336939.1 IS5 family transposase [Escherichia coli]EKQ4421446.1 IS5 family transposase [Escherichia coli]EKQ5277677.1 IS5 family transposase [Escherichia coli]UIR46347.1 IS5 family transposase [Escherichia coli]HCJ5498646.1 IS5 family transposase [Escherichia coli]
MAGNKWQISDELWEKMAPLLPEHKTHHPLGTHRRRVNNRAAMNAILFVLRTGCQWNALNATGICSSSSAHRRFQEWRDAGVFERFWQNGLLACEQLDAIDWSWLSMDGCMTKSPLAGQKTGRNPTDRGKQGVKRSLMTDANGLPLSLVVAGANTHDIKLVADTLDALQTGRPGRRLHLCMDKGYEAEWLEACLKNRRYEPHIQSRKEESEAIKSTDFKAHRWVVERTHNWMNRFRRVLTLWEKKVENYVAMLYLTCGVIVWNKILLG